MALTDVLFKCPCRPLATVNLGQNAQPTGKPSYRMVSACWAFKSILRHHELHTLGHGRVADRLWIDARICGHTSVDECRITAALPQTIGWRCPAEVGKLRYERVLAFNDND